MCYIPVWVVYKRFNLLMLFIVNLFLTIIAKKYQRQFTRYNLQQCITNLFVYLFITLLVLNILLLLTSKRIGNFCLAPHS